MSDEIEIKVMMQEAMDYVCEQFGEQDPEHRITLAAAFVQALASKNIASAVNDLRDEVEALARTLDCKDFTSEHPGNSEFYRKVPIGLEYIYDAICDLKTYLKDN